VYRFSFLSVFTTGYLQATFASKVTLAETLESARVVREVDGGLETVEISLPGVISVDLRLNEPRYATLPNIMKAKKKPIEVIEASSLGVDLTPRHTVLNVSPPPKREAGILVNSVDELIDKLRNEAKVI